MTTVTIQSGACGFSTTVTVEKTKDGKLAVSVETQCDMVRKMCGDIAVLDAVIEDPGTGSACANLGGWLLATPRVSMVC